MATIGFIGLGNMGGPMAENLLKAGHAVQGFDLARESVARAAAAGATAAPSAAAAAEGADVVVTMLPAGRHVRQVLIDDGVLQAASEGTLFIECSTIDVATAREMHAAAEAGDLAMVDAPVSGGTAGAAAATLTFMVGGSDPAFARAEPVCAAMGKAVIHAGGPGNGQAAKICNNMILGVTMIGVCEALVLAEALGLDHQKLFDISSKSSGSCWSLNTYCPVPGPVPTSPANNDYKPGFAAEMMLKDLLLAQEAARAGGTTTPMGAAATALYGLFVNGGEGSTDFSGIIRMIRGN
ncbi:MAG: 3-hydroxyisobutyrate dehydrogenase [Rhodospirillales bacterium]|nr:MAG: 3-hydroxyisobutyrate dehydrogenase [Rhodospirillales bacterium]